MVYLKARVLAYDSMRSLFLASYRKSHMPRKSDFLLFKNSRFSLLYMLSTLASESMFRIVSSILRYSG